MNYLTSLLGPNAPLAATFIVAFAVVLVLIGLTAWIFRLIRGRGLGIGSGGRGRQPRLAVLDYADVDQRRKLVLIRRDNVEHLLLLGGPTDVVVETAIMRGMPVPASALREAPATDPAGQTIAPTEAPRLSIREQARHAAGEYPARPAAPEPLPPPAPTRAEPVRPSLREPSRPEPARPEPPRPTPPREPTRISPVVTPARTGQTVAPTSAPRPAPATASPPAPDDVAARLEAALRKPIGATPGAPAKPAGTGTTMPPPRPQAGRPGTTAPATAPAASAGAAAAANAGKPLSADDKSVFDSLEEEMAALLGRGPTPPKS